MGINGVNSDPGAVRDAVRNTVSGHLDKRRTVILLRSVVMFTTAYLVVFGAQDLTAGSLVYAAVLVGSNLALALAPRWIFDWSLFSLCLLLTDTALVVLGLYRTVGLSQEFLVVYFFTIFLTTAAERLGHIAIGATLVSGLYGYWLFQSTNGSMTTSDWLRIPFVFVVAIFYAFVTDELKVEKRRRHEAEREREQLRVLLQVTGAVSESPIAAECVKNIARFVEDAVPDLRCEVSAAVVSPALDRGAVWLPIEAFGQRFGGIVMRSTNGGVTVNETALARLVIHAVASATYTARQVEVAQEASRLKEEFLATMSHELRTPLHAILGYSDLIEGAAEASGDQSIVDSIGRLRANTRHLHDILEEMMGFAALRAGHAEPREVPLQIPALMNELAGLTRELLVGRPIDVDVEVAQNLPVIMTDVHKLRQALLSQLNNAVKFTERGTVRLSAELRGTDQVVFGIQDSGIGIAEDDVRVIFDEFRQLDGSSTRRFGGVGLGLALARGLLALLGGSLEVSSRPGHGSTFRTVIPLQLADAPRVNGTSVHPTADAASVPEVQRVSA